MPYETDLTNLTPSIKTTGDSVSPASGVMQNFSNSENVPVIYKVTAEDGTTNDYNVTVKISKFKIKIKTDNSGSSNTDQLILPLYPGKTYNFHINWGDGNEEDVTSSSDLTHTYLLVGTYVVAISGDFPAIYFNRQKDKEKIMEIVQWGDVEWETFKNAFYGCSNMTMTATDVPNLTNVTDMSRMFAYATSFNQPLNDWNVSSVTNMKEMFYMATGFNQPLNDWNVSFVTNMQDMFYAVTLSTMNYSNMLISWSTLSLQNDVVFNAGNAKYNASSVPARDKLTDTLANGGYNWTITDGGQE